MGEEVLSGLPVIPRKTVETELLAATAVAADAQQKSSVLDLTSIRDLTLFISHGRTATGAFVGAGTEYRVEASAKATGNDAWLPLASVICGIAAATEITADANEAAGQTLIEIGVNTPAVGDICFWQNNSVDLSEWLKVVAIAAGTTFTCQDGLTTAQAAAVKIYNQGEIFTLNFNTRSYKRLRVIVNNNNGTTNQAIVSKIAATSEVL